MYKEMLQHVFVFGGRGILDTERLPGLGFKLYTIGGSAYR